MGYSSYYDIEWKLELLFSKLNVLIFEYDVVRQYFVWPITGNVFLFRYHFIGLFEQALILRRTDESQT